MAKKNEKSFEELLQRLEEISEKLEEDIGLDESIKLYEEGINISKICYSKLKDAELKITELNADLINEVEE
ncbi:MAG: exodeoxyribonuclease VII small subunit [Melioribacteraceae bacterium]|jgi:exodeoxyribonuclease VII small subunit|nr:exodeoxyribonuclease VII small subunit [Ignavibacteriota bacterium]MBZ0182260.1 exodeoxyribonuclease VII small subunit [Melioribacteraceae bacterium]|tara:strand:- start:11 stop:223 length:213 start_codon:yes stop_codon:yes gene_type:complete